MIAVNGSRNSGGGKTAGHELKKRHLSGSILHGDTVDFELEVSFAADTTGKAGEIGGIIEMGVENLLGESEAIGRAENAANLGEILNELGVGRSDIGERSFSVSGKGTAGGTRERRALETKN